MHKPLHWKDNLHRFKQVLAADHLGIISDFDGTLSHFVKASEEAQITAENAQALDTLAEKVALVALISGRSAQDLRTRFERPYARYHGNHGLDYWTDNGLQIVEAARQWIEPLNALLTDLAVLQVPENVIVQNKVVTASIHYRAVSNPEQVRLELQRLLEPLCERYGFRMSEGRYIWEIKPPLDINKGSALAGLIADYALNGVIFLGDDVTDITAMTMLRNLPTIQGLSVGVIHDGTDRAGLLEHCDVIAHDPDDVARLLHWIDQYIDGKL